MSTDKLTVQDIMLIRRQVEVAQQLNEMLSEALTEIGDVVGGIDTASIQDQKAVEVLDKVKSTVSRLEKEVADFNKRIR